MLVRFSIKGLQVVTNGLNALKTTYRQLLRTISELPGCKINPLAHFYPLVLFVFFSSKRFLHLTVRPLTFWESAAEHFDQNTFINSILTCFKCRL